MEPWKGHGKETWRKKRCTFVRSHYDGIRMCIQRDDVIGSDRYRKC